MTRSQGPTCCAARRVVRSPWGSIALGLVAWAVLATAVSAAPPSRATPPPRMFPIELRAAVPLQALPAGGPATDGRRVYVPVRPTGLVAVSLATGRIAWRTQTAISRGPMYSEGRLFITTADTLEAIDPENGDATWRMPLPTPAVAPPLLTGGFVVVPLESGDVIAVHQADGRLAWQLAVGGRPSGPVLTVGEIFVAALDDGTVVGLTRATGAKKWEQRLGGAATGLAGQGTSVYAGSLDNFFYCLDANTGRIKWRWRTGADVVGEPSVDGKRVYFVSMDNLIRALDRDSGVQRWKKPLVARPVVGPLRIGDLLLLSSLSADLRAVSAETGEAVGRYDLGGELGAAPVFSAGEWPVADLLVAVTVDGTLLMLGRKVSPGMVPLAALPGTTVPVEATPPPPPEPPPG